MATSTVTPVAFPSGSNLQSVQARISSANSRVKHRGMAALTSHHAVRDCAEALDLDRDGVAVPQKDRGLARHAHTFRRAGQDDSSRQQGELPGKVADDLGGGEYHIG